MLHWSQFALPEDFTQGILTPRSTVRQPCWLAVGSSEPRLILRGEMGIGWTRSGGYRISGFRAARTDVGCIDFVHDGIAARRSGGKHRPQLVNLIASGDVKGDAFVTKDEPSLDGSACRFKAPVGATECAKQIRLIHSGDVTNARQIYAQAFELELKCAGLILDSAIQQPGDRFGEFFLVDWPHDFPATTDMFPWIKKRDSDRCLKLCHGIACPMKLITDKPIGILISSSPIFLSNDRRNEVG